MILSQTSEYAIRVMSTLALLEDASLARAKDLSEEADIPMHYLSKILRKLVQAKLLAASKGHNGGFVLAKSPQKIKMVDIIEAVDLTVPEKHCIFGWRMCNAKDPCILHHRWSSVNDAFQLWARNTTLADVKKDAASLGWLLKSKKLKS